jgi:hypothetical protein
MAEWNWNGGRVVASAAARATIGAAHRAEVICVSVRSISSRAYRSYQILVVCAVLARACWTVRVSRR